MSINNTFLITGRSFSGIEKAIERRSDSFIILKDSKISSPTTGRRQTLVNFENQKQLNEALNDLRGEVDGAVCAYENYVINNAYIAHNLGLPGIPITAAEICTDKYLMRQALEKAPQAISTEYLLIEDEKSLLSFAEKVGLPIIIKPANLMKSLLVSKSINQAELLKNYRQSQQKITNVYSRYAPGRKPKLLAEEFLSGSVHSVEALVDIEGEAHVLRQIVDYQTGYDIGYDDNFHYSRLLPSNLELDKQAEVRKVAKLGVKALGMKSSPAHIEIIYTAEGPRIVEIGARVGGYRDRMHRLANGLSINSLALDLALGEKPAIKAARDEPCAVLELFPKTPGKFLGINNQSRLEGLSSLVYFRIKQKVGKHVGKSSQGYKMCAIIILHNKTRKQFETDLNFVNNQVYVKTA